MRILAIDIGAGTQDILLYDSERAIENCTSLVLPTPSVVFAKKLLDMHGEVYIYGDTVGGGPLAAAILEHIQRGYRVAMDESAAYSIRNDLEEVRSMGILVRKDPEFKSLHEMEIREIDLAPLFKFLSNFGEEPDVNAIAIAVQDHGVAPPGISDRIFRFKKLEEMLQQNNTPESFHFLNYEVPDYYLRMRSAVRAAKRTVSLPVVTMDTAFSAILGCLDEGAGPSLIVNVGNGHTIAALVLEKKIEGVYEHHTHELTSGKLEDELQRFVRGELSTHQVYEENGHGVITLKPFFGEISVRVTGPNRNLFKDTSMKYTFASPAGNTMMTGPLGLVKATLYRLRNSDT